MQPSEGPRAHSRLRAALGRPWLIALFGVAYLVSQIAILAVLAPLGSSVLRLQCLGFSAETVLATYREWEATGGMAAYRAHFALDDVHWVWYAGFFTTLLCWLFERRRVPHRHDWVLLLPLASGLLDAAENRIQHGFLESAGFSAVVDPWPLLGTLASIGKWTLAAVYVSLAIALVLARGGGRRRPAA